jgi:hypothetical protein
VTEWAGYPARANYCKLKPRDLARQQDLNSAVKASIVGVLHSQYAQCDEFRGVDRHHRVEVSGKELRSEDKLRSIKGTILQQKGRFNVSLSSK